MLLLAAPPSDLKAGSEYLTRHPAVPIESIIADVNFDVTAVYRGAGWQDAKGDIRERKAR